MRKMKKIYLLFIIVLNIYFANAQTESKSKRMAAPSVSQSSTEITIGNQIWMTENLDVFKFRNGDTIFYARTKEEWLKANMDKKPAYCFFENLPGSAKKYGKLYNWYAVNDPRGLAPAGWHIPSDAEWKILTDFLGGDTKASSQLKYNKVWAEEGCGTNSSGFAAIPGDCITDEGNDSGMGVGMAAYWWTSTESSPTQAWNRNIFIREAVYRELCNKGYGCSIRCIKD